MFSNNFRKLILLISLIAVTTSMMSQKLITSIDSTSIFVGEEITYSGYPSWHSLMTYRGRVAGYETHPEAGTQIMLNTYGWFGCSGSLIYDKEGRAVGILWGVDLQRGLPQENMIWVSPMQNLDIKLALKPLCTGLSDKPKACRGI